MENQVRVRFGFPTSSAYAGHHPTIEIDDDASGQPIARIELTPEQFATIMGSGQVTALARYMPSPKIYEQRIGKNMEIKRVPVEEWPEGWTLRNPSSVSDAHHTSATDEMHIVGRGFLADGWQEYSWSRHNYGWSLTLRRWVEVE